jgi:asparagine N-glycosylation enzyme membrane subunit Stt3
MDKKEIISFLKNKRFQWAVTLIIFLVILFMSSSIRLSNWDLLTDSISGEKIPLALDPYYFLRVAETLVENGGELPEFDIMRSSVEGTAWHPEIMPRVIVRMYQVANLFGDYSLRAVDVFSPVAFYFIGMIVFFLLCYFLTKSKIASLISSGLLAFSPAYLYRTMAGFADHESIGMVAVFACLLFYVFVLKNFERDWRRTILYGLGLGFFTSLVLASWSGASILILMVVPFSFLTYWLLKNRDKVKAILFYVVWIVSALLMPGIFNKDLISWMITRFSATYGLIIPAVLGFMLIDFAVEWLMKKKWLKINEERKLLWVIGVSVVLGSIALTFIGKNIFSVIKAVWHAVLFPFGTGRVDMTVAENAQPYLTDWIGQSGSMIFWLFVFGIFLIGIEFRKAIKSKKHSVWFSLAWVVMISAMLFSRISSSSMFNGENFVSQVVYLIGVGIFGIYFIWLNMYKMFDREKVDSLLILLMALIFIVVLNGRSAIRTFFLITPFVLLSVGYFVIRVLRYAMKSKEEAFKIVLWGLFLFALGGVIFSASTYRENISNQAKYTGPSANVQWQGAMSWVRDNTNEGDKFVHWWDYGYWVQTLGERPTISDGGHFQGVYNGNERVGRYLLTTGNPATAYSLMKSHNISYLLIDPTDLGKYGAYSKIGSDDSWDRFSSIPVGVFDEKSVQETASGIIRAYQFGSIVDEDIYYNNIFLPGPSYDDYGRPSYKAFIGGIILNVSSNGTINQPMGVYVYNNIQYRIPLRYLYFNDILYDFGGGLDATIRLIPALQQAGQGMNVNPFGAAIYLSPKTGRSLFAKLYLMNDPFDEYGDIVLAHAEDSPVIVAMKAQGVVVGDFVYYQGFRGPIKIWKVDYPEGTPIYEEFLKLQTGYGDIDWRFE